MMPNRQGGMSRHCEEIYARLAARGHHVSIYCSSRPQGAEYRGMHLRKVPSLGVPGWDRLGYSLLATLIATFGRYDVVHYHSLANTGFCFIPAAARKRVVVTIHRIEWQDEKWGAVTRAFLRWSEWCAMRCANAVISVSAHLKDDVTRAQPSGRDIRVISNGATMPDDTGHDALDALGIDARTVHPQRRTPRARQGLGRRARRARRARPAETDGLEYVIAGGARIETDYVRELHAAAAAPRSRCAYSGWSRPRRSRSSTRARSCTSRRRSRKVSRSPCSRR